MLQQSVVVEEPVGIISIEESRMHKSEEQLLKMGSSQV